MPNTGDTRQHLSSPHKEATGNSDTLGKSSDVRGELGHSQQKTATAAGVAVPDGWLLGTALAALAVGLMWFFLLAKRRKKNDE
ncbi:MAG: hypothetical protein SPF30_07030 [Arcanobacterium sp.]|nr:hypothetical protein [Arcanobacterium sp.]